MKEFTLEDDVTIEIGFTQEDLEELANLIHKNETMEFVESTNTGREFKIVLMSHDEHEQRRK